MSDYDSGTDNGTEQKSHPLLSAICLCGRFERLDEPGAVEFDIAMHRLEDQCERMIYRVPVDRSRVDGEATPDRHEAVEALIESEGWARHRARAFVAEHGPEGAREMVASQEARVA